MPNAGKTEKSKPHSIGLGKRELIVIFRREAGLRVTKGEFKSSKGIDVTPLTNLLASEGIVIYPIFALSEEELESQEIPDLSVYYKIDASDHRLDQLAEYLRSLNFVEAAYVKPPTLLGQPPNPPTPDFTNHQGYLNASPEGVNAKFAWGCQGGTGLNVDIIDIEYGWLFDHEDLRKNQSFCIDGQISNKIEDREHGTKVLGVIRGDRNEFGITGICPDAFMRTCSLDPQGSAHAIDVASASLDPGDIILIVIQQYGPRYGFMPRWPGSQYGCIPIEWWPDDFDAIRRAVKRGLIVVEIAGNGHENLDDPIYDQKPEDFPDSWTNPFNRSNPNSGAIIVGEGEPLRNPQWAPARSRLDESNYGTRVDVQGWGWAITTCHGGDLWGGPLATPPDPKNLPEQRWYTGGFGGTCGAAAIVTGVIGCLQGVLRANNRFPLSSLTARELLRSTGLPQQDAPGRPSTQRIGNFPNLGELIGVALQITEITVLERNPFEIYQLLEI